MVSSSGTPFTSRAKVILTHDQPVSEPANGGTLRFFLLTFAVSWTCFAVAEALLRSAPSPPPALQLIHASLFYLGVFTPALVALALTDRREGRGGTMALLRRILEWRVRARWYVFAAGYMAAIKLSVAVVHRVATGAWPRFGEIPLYVMIGAIAVSTWVQAGEEIGWRGYALPRMAARIGFGRASILLGVIWASWHLPVFFSAGYVQTGQSFPVYLLQVTAISVAMAWLYVNTGGSLLLVMLMHAAVNNTKDIVPSAVPGATNPFAVSNSLVAWLTVVFMWIAAAYFLARIRSARLPHTREPAAHVRTRVASPI